MDIGRALDAVCAQRPSCNRDVLGAVFTLAVEIAREGHEGQRVGTLFTIGRPADILANSRSLILDPLAGHAPGSTHISDEQLRGTIKQLAHLDGAFIMADDGTVVSGCRYLDVPTGGVELPLGLGSRHLAAASISKQFGVITIVVSTSGILRVFSHGTIVASVGPFG